MTLRRRPDGRPEIRSLDDMLAEVAHDDDVQRLPGRGRPLDLHGYRHSDPETRVANRLLRDNNVIPQPLQDRRDAERLEEQAAEVTRRGAEDLGRRRQEATDLRRRLCCVWPAQVAVEQVFGDVPDGWTEEATSADPSQAVALAADLAAAVERHNRQRAVLRRQVEERLTRAEALTKRINQQVSLSRTMPPGVQRRPVDVERGLQRFDEGCPPLDEVPGNLAERLREALRAAAPRWWQRARWRRPARS